jgi:hypothetical protein
MTIENKNQQPTSHYNSSILNLIYEDASESVKILRDDINSINTRLTLVIGFNATFASLLPRLPSQTSFKTPVQEITLALDAYPHAKQLLNLLLTIINWCLLIKPLITLLLGASVVFAVLSVLPSTTPVVLFPKNMLEKSKNCSEEAFRKGIIQNRNETIERLQNIISKKALKWKYALLTLGGAAVLSAVDILININMTSH